jgi:hypothetical protein
MRRPSRVELQCEPANGSSAEVRGNARPLTHNDARLRTKHYILPKIPSRSHGSMALLRGASRDSPDVVLLALSC